MNVSVYSVILEKDVFSGVFLYRRVNTCYRCYGHARPARKLSVPEKMRFRRIGCDTTCPWRKTDEYGGDTVSAVDMVAMIGARAVQTPRRRRMAIIADNFPCPGRKPPGGAFIRLPEVNTAHGGWGVPRAVWVRLSWHAHGRSARTNSHVRNESRSISKFRIRSNSGAPPPPWLKRLVFTCNTYSPAYKGKPRKKRLSPKWVNTLIHQCITFYVFLIFQYLSLWKSVFSSN